MSTDVADIFDRQKESLRSSSKEWLELKDEIVDELGPEFEREVEELESLTEDLLTACDEAIEQIENPTVTLATTGTTSGGKSTIVNFLCGARLMPTAVNEKSAGLVSIEHDPDECSLEIKKTTGARWECGLWEDQTVDQIRNRMAGVMDEYHELCRRNDPPKSPSFHVKFPTKVGKNPAQIGLEDNFEIRILDLPGLRHVDDERNAEVIRKCRDALCLVTYNSAETDPEKQSRLLREVVRQVQNLGGSPARMMFILNKFDVFQKDENSEDEARRFYRQTVDQIENELEENLPEYSDEINDLNLLKFSSHPALLANILSRGSESRESVAKQLEDHYSFMIPDDILFSLPRRHSQWDDGDCRRVAEEIASASRSHNFMESLRKHVQGHLPELILPQVIAPYIDALNAAHGAAEQIVSAQMHKSREKFEKEKERIDEVSEDLKRVRAICNEPFLEASDGLYGIYDDITPSDRDDNSLDGTPINKAIEPISNSYGNFDPTPLHKWVDAFNNDINNFIKEVCNGIKLNVSLNAETFDELSAGTRQELEEARSELISNGFREYSGQEVSKEKKRNNDIRYIKDSLGKFSKIMEKAIEEKAKRVGDRQSERVFNQLDHLFQMYVDRLWDKSKEVADSIGLEQRPPEDMRRAERKSGEFETEVELQIEEHTEKKRDGTKRVKTGTERRPYTLWLVKHDVYEEKPDYVYKYYEKSYIPSTNELYQRFKRQFEVQMIENSKYFTDWLIEQFEEMMNGIERFQEELIERYYDRLKKVHESAREKHENRLDTWESLQKEFKSWNREDLEAS